MRIENVRLLYIKMPNVVDSQAPKAKSHAGGLVRGVWLKLAATPRFRSRLSCYTGPCTFTVIDCSGTGTTGPSVPAGLEMGRAAGILIHCPVSQTNLRKVHCGGHPLLFAPGLLSHLYYRHLTHTSHFHFHHAIVSLRLPSLKRFTTHLTSTFE